MAASLTYRCLARYRGVHARCAEYRAQGLVHSISARVSIVSVSLCGSTSSLSGPDAYGRYCTPYRAYTYTYPRPFVIRTLPNLHGHSPPLTPQNPLYGVACFLQTTVVKREGKRYAAVGKMAGHHNDAVLSDTPPYSTANGPQSTHGTCVRMRAGSSPSTSSSPLWILTL